MILKTNLGRTKCVGNNIEGRVKVGDKSVCISSYLLEVSEKIPPPPPESQMGPPIQKKTQNTIKHSECIKFTPRSRGGGGARYVVSPQRHASLELTLGDVSRLCLRLGSVRTRCNVAGGPIEWVTTLFGNPLC